LATHDDTVAFNGSFKLVFRKAVSLYEIVQRKEKEKKEVEKKEVEKKEVEKKEVEPSKTPFW
jgi:hypothetical protein